MLTYFVLDYAVKKNLTKNVNIKYKLAEDRIPLKNIKGVALPPNLKIGYKNINFQKLFSRKFGETIYKFSEIMVNNFSSKNLINFYNNINELIIKDRRKLKKLFKKFPNASYFVFENKICIYENNIKVDLPHELFHMASSYVDLENNIEYCGFSQDIKEDLKINRIGEGINEGYTQFMIKKYYGNDYGADCSSSYKLLMIISEKIEKILGKDKMENLYLTANLKGLIDELSIYMKEEDIIKFINVTDYLKDNINLNNKKQVEEDQLRDSLIYISYFLISLGTLNAIKKIKYKEINFDEFIDILNEISNFGISIKIKDKEYSTMSRELTLILIESILKEKKLNVTEAALKNI